MSDELGFFMLGRDTGDNSSVEACLLPGNNVFLKFTNRRVDPPLITPLYLGEAAARTLRLVLLDALDAGVDPRNEEAFNKMGDKTQWVLVRE